MSNDTTFNGIKTDDSITYGYPADEPPSWDKMKTPSGGRRHKGSKKMHKGKRHGNASLRAWVTFVKKVQREEKVSYKEAMMRAKQRKDKGEKWRGGDNADLGKEDYGEEISAMFDGDGDKVVEETVVIPPTDSIGGRRRRRHRTQRRSRSHSRASRRSRSHRRSRRHH